MTTHARHMTSEIYLVVCILHILNLQQNSIKALKLHWRISDTEPLIFGYFKCHEYIHRTLFILV